MTELPVRFSPIFDGQYGITHGFFGRKGGVSSGKYASLNTGRGSDDDPRAVAENRRRIASAFAVPPAALLTNHQCHSRDVEIASAAWPDHYRPKADAIVTKTAGLALGALAADCAPVLLADPAAKVIGAVHAGWRGALSGVTDSAIEAMESLGARRENIIAAIGPCMSQKHFEVGPEFVRDFLQERSDNARFFQPGTGDRSLFDNKAYLAAKIARAGLVHIHALPDCTYAQESDYFSYRRNCHARVADYGRNISVIMLNAHS